MTLRQEMIQALGRAPLLLDKSTGLVSGFVLRHLDHDGGFMGRDNKSDLYYTVFGIELAISLELSLPVDLIKRYLAGFESGHGLDLVHLSCLARSYTNLADISSFTIDSGLKEGLTQRLVELRCADGSFSANQSDAHGNAYGCFMALTMCEDMGVAPPDPDAILNCLDKLEMDDGGFANEQAGGISTTPSTAAAICSYHMLGRPLPERGAEWLMGRASERGGFCAFKSDSPMNLPDLLSTATALQAISYFPENKIIREGHLEFLDTLWNPEGGFSGTWADPVIDCEYTYYGLLALGYLAEIP
ncbi:MAG: terpene cyclase/mutase family protein [Desulfatiglans sp.]|jgi:prenyltransferase beta subunit|nr:terpene cyclase/mutase family protein [Desulfatiglans sp.]